MRLFLRTIKYRLKKNFITLKGLVLLLLTLAAAIMPLIGTLKHDSNQKPVLIGWVDNDNSEYSRQLLNGVEEYPLLSVKQTNETKLIAELKTGKLEAVFVVNKGFEDIIKKGEYEDTLTMHKSAYSSVAGVISEGVVAKVMQIWLAEYSSSIARQYRDDEAAKNVFEGVLEYMVTPIMSIERKGVMQEYIAPSPLYESAQKSLYITAAISCLFMLINAAAFSGSNSFEDRSSSNNFSMESYRMAVGMADVVFLLPGCFPAAIAFCIAGSTGRSAIILLMYVLYLLSYSGVGALLCTIKSKTVHVMSISVITIVNLAFGALLIDMPTVGIVPILSYVLPSRWLTSIDIHSLYSVYGLIICTAVYNALPFLTRKLKIQKRPYDKTV